MKIKLLASLSGPKGSWSAGDEYECGEAEARRMIERGVAVPAREQRAEKAVKRAPETSKRKG